MSYDGEVEYETTGDLNDAIYYERLDVDREQAAMEAAGSAYYRRYQKAKRLIEQGFIEEGVQVCPHGHAGGLDGSCTEDDPRHGEEGYRCFECGAHISDLHGTVLHVR